MSHQSSFLFLLHVNIKAMLHEAIFLATCNTTMMNKKPFKLQRARAQSLFLALGALV